MATSDNKINLWKTVRRLFPTLVFPPSRKRWRIILLGFKLLLRLIRNLIRNGEEAFWDFIEEGEDLFQEVEEGDIIQGDDLANLRQALREMARTFRPTFKTDLIPLSYYWQTSKWIKVTLDEDLKRAYNSLFKQIQYILEGRNKPLFIPFAIPIDAELVEHLKRDEVRDAIKKMERVSFEQVLSLIPSGSALVYLVSSDSGTFSIVVQKDITPEIVLCQSLTRQRVENLLRGWLWLYYFHSENIYTRYIEYQLGKKKKSREYEESFTEASLKIPYKLLFNNQTLFEYLQPTEIPANNGIPAIPFPSWLLMEAILRELGKGDLSAGEGLWNLLDEKLRASKIKRIILCPDKAFALFPHHAAILNIDRNGQKECVLDRYQMVYLPQGMLTRVKPVKLQPPRILLFGTEGEELTSVGIENLRHLAPDCVSEWHSSLDKPDPDREKLSMMMQTINTLTFLGHGKYDWENPSTSFLGLLLDRNDKRCNDERKFNDVIILSNLVKLVPPHLNLIVLAGCETGLPKITKLVSDYNGFAEDLLSQCNVSAVISTLWPVPPISTILLICEFHKYWLQGHEMTLEKPLQPAAALRKAQLWLRTLTCEQSVFELEKIVSDESWEEFTSEIQVLRNSIVEYPFAHPYFWAAFYVLGDVSWTH